MHTAEETPFNLEAAIAEVRSIAERLQKGLDGFDEQVALFKRGKQLVNQCLAYLDQAEMDIRLLSDEGLIEAPDSLQTEK